MNDRVMSETKHTPGKVSAFTDESDNHTNIVAFTDQVRVLFSLPGRDKHEPDIARLVLCWNTHDELLAKLRAIIDQEQYDGDAETHMHDMADLARAAIASATKA